MKSDLENPEVCLVKKTSLLNWMPDMIIPSAIPALSLP